MNAWDEWNERIGDAIYDIQQYGEELENIQKIVDLTGRNDDFYDDYKRYDGDLYLEVKYPKNW